MAETGLATPEVAAALAAWAAERSPRTRAAALAALAQDRVFAAVVARSTAEHVDPGTGLRAESTAEMSLVTLSGRGGRAVPVFLDVPAVTAFAEGARPVRLTLAEACTAAQDDGAVALVVDPGRTDLVLQGAELAELAAGRLPVAGAPLSTRVATGLRTPDAPDLALVRALAEAVQGEGVEVRLLDGPDGPVLGLVSESPLDPAALAALAARLAPRLPVALDLAVVPPDGPGVPLPRLTGGPRRRWLRRPGR